MKAAAIIQARMGSARLPGKVLKEICGKTVLSHLIERVKQCKLLDDIIVATTVNETDDKIEQEAASNCVKVFRGSEQDVLSRYYFAAIENKADIIVRITSDCPLFDPELLYIALEKYLTHKYDIVHIGVSGGFPRGFDAEIFAFQLLKEAFEKADKDYHREHVTPYIYENYLDVFSIKCEENLSKYRITLDTDEDFEVIDRIYKGIYKGSHNFYFQDIIKFLKENPEIAEINAHIEQKKIK